MSFELSRKQVAIGVAIGVGALGVQGCTNYNDSKDNHATPYFKGNTFVIPSSGNSDSTKKISCDGANLQVEVVGDDTEVYLNDPACVDSKFTPEDLAAK